MDKKIQELKKKIDILEMERMTLIERRKQLDQRLSDIISEQLRASGGIEALTEAANDKDR